MVCPSCRFENIEGSDECTNCGASLYGLDLPDAPLGSQSPNFIHDLISLIPIRKPPTVSPADPVSLAISEMRRNDSNSVLVMDSGKLAGIITGWDIVQKVAGPRADFNAVTCGQIMTADPLVLQETDTVAMALNMMAARGFRHVPIVNGDGPIGLIVASDLFRHVSPHLV